VSGETSDVHSLKPTFQPATLPSIAGQFGLILVVAMLLLNLGYGFSGTLTSLGKFDFVSRSMTGEKSSGETGTLVKGNRFTGSLLGSVRMPVPKDYLMGIDVQKWDFERRPASYLGGQWSRDGWWYYYLYALAIKEPLGTWVLLAMALLMAGTSFLNNVKQHSGLTFLNSLFLLLPAVFILFLVSSQTGMNHHMRYALPALPFLFVWMGRVGRDIVGGSKLVLFLVIALLAWIAFSSLSVYPHSIAYFNELVGGPRNGHKHLINSNIDWGQDLMGVKRWLDRNPNAQPFFFAYSLPLVSPQVAGIETAPPPTIEQLRDARKLDQASDAETQKQPDAKESQLLAPGWYAVSVSCLHSKSGRYEYFEPLEPQAHIGWSILIYHLTPEQIPTIKAWINSH
jgi:hypothetical protein